LCYLSVYLHIESIIIRGLKEQWPHVAINSTTLPITSQFNFIHTIPIQIDILDASASFEGPSKVHIYVSVRLVEWYKRLGDDEAIAKLKKVVNLDAIAMRHNGRGH